LWWGDGDTDVFNAYPTRGDFGSTGVDPKSWNQPLTHSGLKAYARIGRLDQTT